MLQETYTQLLERYTTDKKLIAGFWAEIATHYSSENRHYHTLSHLENILQQLIPVKDRIENWDVVLFTLYYHDIIYDALKPDNEEQSAELAAERMEQLNIPVQLIGKCKDQILATKTHVKSPDNDTNYFTDADLSILGQDAERYRAYSKNVRLEYAHYPDAVYNEGRTKVLNHFLNLERIYKTDFFYEKYEERAKQHILEEIKELQHTIK